MGTVRIVLLSVETMGKTASASFIRFQHNEELKKDINIHLAAVKRKSKKLLQEIAEDLLFLLYIVLHLSISLVYFSQIHINFGQRGLCHRAHIEY